MDESEQGGDTMLSVFWSLLSVISSTGQATVTRTERERLARRATDKGDGGLNKGAVGS